jgi:hypothetical protein
MVTRIRIDLKYWIHIETNADPQHWYIKSKPSGTVEAHNYFNMKRLEKTKIPLIPNP